MHNNLIDDLVHACVHDRTIRTCTDMCMYVPVTVNNSYLSYAKHNGKCIVNNNYTRLCFLYIINITIKYIQQLSIAELHKTRHSNITPLIYIQYNNTTYISNYIKTTIN